MAIRTDLAAEAAFDGGKLRNGIKHTVRRTGGCEVTDVTVETDSAGRSIGKPAGRYITIDTSDKSADFTEQADVIAEELRRLCGCTDNILIVGLGNREITPDAIGPMTADGVIATRHLTDELPKGHFLRDLNSVSALASGVLGQTGIEAAEIVRAVCEKISPSCVIAADALACSDFSRLGTTVQLTDTGISPGSGVQNRRKELSRRTLGVPVIAVGVPTVIDMHTAYENLSGKLPDGKLPNLMVTPRDIDRIAEKMSKLLSIAINRAFQPMLTHEDIAALS